MIHNIILIASLFLSQMHPFHVSVCDVEFKAQSKVIQVSQRIFLNDFEKALSKRFDIEMIIDDESKITYRDSLIQVYLFENFHLLVDGKEKRRMYIGNEVEEDAMWCYIEYSGIKKLNSIEVRSTILLETFDDQANIIHIKSGDFERSIKLDNHEKVKEITIED